MKGLVLKVAKFCSYSFLSLKFPNCGDKDAFCPPGIGRRFSSLFQGETGRSEYFLYHSVLYFSSNFNSRSSVRHCGIFWSGLLWSQVKMKVNVAQSCPTLCDPMDYTVHGILQARILQWVAVPSSRVSSQPRDRTQVSCNAGGFFTIWATRETPLIPVRSNGFVCVCVGGGIPWGFLYTRSYCLQIDIILIFPFWSGDFFLLPLPQPVFLVLCLSTMLSSIESRYLCFIPDLGQKVSSLSPLSKKSAVGFSISSLLCFFLIMKVSNFIKCFLIIM